jgi:hypothetical protein
MIFNNNGVCQKIISFEKNGYTHFLNNKFPEEEKNNYINEVSNFRNIFMGDTDFFGDVYNKYLLQIHLTM